MTKSNLQKPTKVERARARLDAAVARLEAALENRAASGSPEGPDADAALKLSGELEALRKENDTLKSVNETVSGRLDGAIGRLKAVIGPAPSGAQNKDV